ncbi:D-amino-acid transaminase [Paenibacillus mesotrionivorans]|uniref:D-amino-acid transaminase n=1 Tax=Paenibacillus mesotrionivorans TaxID=3160968 RepID=A0ACC7NXJ2_9BACL
MKFLHNLTITDYQDATIHPDDRGYYFGDGIYEVFRIYNGRLFQEDAHLVRLARSAAELRIPLPYGLPEITGLMYKLLEEDPVEEGILYLQITRGAAPRGHAFPPEGTQPVLTAYCKPLPRNRDKITGGIRIVSVPDIRWLRCDIKTLNLLGNVLAKQEAVERGADEAVLHRSGTVTECSSSNIMMVKDGTLWTHPADNLILPGITRQVVLEQARTVGIPVQEAVFSLEELYSADEVLITGTTTEVTPVILIDETPIAGGQPGPITRQLQREYQTLFM